MSGGSPIEERMAAQDRRVHVNIGPTCNNNCIFCMEEDRDLRREVNSALGSDRVRVILEAGRGAEEVCFTSGEPTLVRDLPRFLHWARQLGYPRRSLMTNGRRLASPRYLELLLSAGLNFVYVSIHGHEARLHDALTRAPGSFEQTVAGLENLHRRRGDSALTVHTSTVVNRRNLPHLAAIYAFLRERGVDQVVFNVMQATGRGDTFFDQLFPPYAEIASAFATFLAGCEESPEAYLVDIPLCATEGLPDRNRGYVEAYVHYEAHDPQRALDPAASRAAGRSGAPAEGLLEVARADLDAVAREKREACGRCRHDGRCEGVWKSYLARHGWAGLEPVGPA
ncbi:MAG: radical SAM protein [Deltaproteobacteria bacterium]|nr:radical SAM protein [Deltaproteobacteria bacterium]